VRSYGRERGKPVAAEAAPTVNVENQARP
jgi:hypothetical protein